MTRTSKPVLARLGAALMLSSLLSGCVAALAVPLMTATGALSERKRESAEERAPAPEAAPALAVASTGEAEGSRATAPGLITTEFALSPHSPAVAASKDWNAFVSYSLDRHALRAEGSPVDSALLAADSAASLEPRRSPCTERETAVLLDLDADGGPFDPGAAGQAAPGVAAAVAQLRAAGIVVLWISQLDANRIDEVAEALQRSGLDPAGRDPILLALSPGDRKQVIRQQADETVCVVAMAGDERSDFDELFDYLRNPDAGFRFDAMLGSGWFLVPAVIPQGAATLAPSAMAPAGEDGGG